MWVSCGFGVCRQAAVGMGVRAGRRASTPQSRHSSASGAPAAQIPRRLPPLHTHAWHAPHVCVRGACAVQPSSPGSLCAASSSKRCSNGVFCVAAARYCAPPLFARADRVPGAELLSTGTSPAATTIFLRVKRPVSGSEKLFFRTAGEAGRVVSVEGLSPFHRTLILRRDAPTYMQPCTRGHAGL